VSRSYKCSQCSHILQNGEDWESHLFHKHGVQFSGSHRQAAVAAAELKRDVNIKDMKCPLCYESLGDSRKSFASHLGQHLEAIALRIIPGDPDNDSASESDVEGTSPYAPPEVPEKENDTDSTYGQVYTPEVSTDASYCFVNASDTGMLNSAQRQNIRALVMKDHIRRRAKERPLPQFSAVTLQKKLSASEDINLPLPFESLVERADTPFGRSSALPTNDKDDVRSLTPRPAPLLTNSGLPPHIIQKEQEKQPFKNEDRDMAIFECHLCARHFTYPSILRSHLRTHTDKRPFTFTCTVCGKAFARQHDRQKHEARHTAEKRCVCQGSLINGVLWGCGRHFLGTDALRRHFRSNVGVECLKPLLEEEVNQKNAGEVSSESLESASRPWPVKLLQQHPELEYVDEGIGKYLEYDVSADEGVD